jgi:hypothetical protein
VCNRGITAIRAYFLEHPAESGFEAAAAAKHQLALRSRVDVR